MAAKDLFRIKVRAAELNVTLNEIVTKIRDEEGLGIFRQQLQRARNNEVKTPRDYEILNAADRVLTRLEAKEMKGD